MSKVEVTYSGNMQCSALNTQNDKRVAVDCSMTRAQEFGPETLVAAGLGSCMLISMAGFAERHGIDVSGTRADVDAALGGKPEMRITAIDVTVHVPRALTDQQQTSLQMAAEACPIKHSFRPDTAITTRFVFGDTAAAAA